MYFGGGNRASLNLFKKQRKKQMEIKMNSSIVLGAVLCFIVYIVGFIAVFFLGNMVFTTYAPYIGIFLAVLYEVGMICFFMWLDLKLNKRCKDALEG